MLTYYGVYNDLDFQGVVIFSGFFIVGVIIALFINKTKVQLRISLGLVSVLLLLEVGIILPTPKILSGDGYAITREISLILATYLAPIVMGVIVCFAIKLLVGFIKSKRGKT